MSMESGRLLHQEGSCSGGALRRVLHFDSANALNEKLRCSTGIMVSRETSATTVALEALLEFDRGTPRTVCIT